MRICLLDMGQTKYGDCILVTHGRRNILIDGGHAGDSDRIRSQLKKLFNQAPPFPIDLLVVTHCHSDHIGCLPTLVGAGDFSVKWALVADERLGWGIDASNADPARARNLSDQQRTLAAALQEEDHSDLPPNEMSQFFQDAASLADRYGQMLETLENKGTTIIRYGRDSSERIQHVEADFAGLGLMVLGPTTDHLLLCAESINRASDAIADAVSKVDGLSGADDAGMTQAYRRLLGQFRSDAAFAADRPGIGAAKNDQSIVLRVKAEGWSALLAGDMQFAKAEVVGLDTSMANLLQKVVDAGPYDFIKLTHHTSYNGLDDEVLNVWGTTKLFGHSGGSNDPSHPDPTALHLLENHESRLTFGRTDHNGMITVQKENGNLVMSKDRGEFNDFYANEPNDTPQGSTPSKAMQPISGSPAQVPMRSEPQIVRTPSGDFVTVSARVPHTNTKVTVTIEVEPDGVEKKNVLTPIKTGDTQPRSLSAPKFQVGGSRSKSLQLPSLLFVSCGPKLAKNIGDAEAGQVLEAIRNTPGAVFVDLSADVDTADQAAATVRRRLVAGNFAGVVVLGGFDVVPPDRLDVLDGVTRQRLEAAQTDDEDADNFIVWSDELYGDQDGDSLPELPVSRIPDGRLSDVVFSALQASPKPLDGKYGMRNKARPFAQAIYNTVPGNGGALELSERAVMGDGVATGAVYFMLHGSARDGTRFWGETSGGAPTEAVAVERLPKSAQGAVVFTGCCWGALTMSPPAGMADSATPLRSRGPEASIAVAFLHAGALAFVGCTGSHYSPTSPPYDYFGKPMHQAFWTFIKQNKRPAEALFLAKREFARGMPHGQTDPFSRAVELKILRQYCCLGLGW